MDGNPYRVIGHRVHVQLDPGRQTLFHNIQMFIDDIKYIVNNTDFYSVATLGKMDVKPRVSGNMSFVHAEEYKKQTRLAIDYRDASYRETFTG